MVNYKEIENVLSSIPKNIYLTPYGNEYGLGSCVKNSEKCSIEENAKKFDIERIETAVQQIPHCFKMLRNMPRCNSSYGLKHHLEHKGYDFGISNNYITNGDFIVAMILCGYNYKFPKLSGQYLVNARLNAKNVYR